MHIHIYAYVYLYIYILIYVYIYSSALNTYIYTHVYIYTYIHIYLYIYPWAYPPTLFFHPLSSSTHSLFSPSYTSESARLRTPTLLSCCAAVLVSWLTQMSAMTLSHVWHHPCIYTYTSIHQHYTFECYDTSFECYDTFIMSAMTLSHVWHHPWVMYHVAGACPRDRIPQSLPVHFFGSQPQPTTSHKSDDARARTCVTSPMRITLQVRALASTLLWEVGGWGRDPKKCTGRDWGMGSSTI